MGSPDQISASELLSSYFTCLQNASFEELLSSPDAIGTQVTGWIQTPNIRGTWDILWTCLATTFLCTHTLLCLNVPAPQESAVALVIRRVKWMTLAIFAPEVVLTYAAGQWSRARQSVEAFQAKGYTTWNMRMAFFADMGGFVLQTPDCSPFPLNAKQLHWLVSQEYIDYPSTTQEEIWDKSKQDRTTKAITAFQISYFVFHCIGRAAQHLPVTTIELSTLAIVVCSLMTAFAWQHKPAGVMIPVRIYSHSLMRDMVEGTGDWRQTPLDFIDPNLPGWSLNVQPFMGMPTVSNTRPIQHIPNDRFPTNPHGPQEYLLCLSTLIFTAIHVAAWNFSFPSATEQIAWRICSTALFAVTALFWFLETIASWVRLGRWRRICCRLLNREMLPANKLDETQPMREDRDPKDLPQAWEFWTIAPIGVLYGLARMYLIVEAFLELRSLEVGAFLSVNWENYMPHI